MMIDNPEFNEYIEKFKQRTTIEKRREVKDKLTALAVLTNKMCNELEIENGILYNREIDDLTNESCSEDDFLEGEIVFLYSIQNSLCDFSNKITDILEEISE